MTNETILGQLLIEESRKMLILQIQALNESKTLTRKLSVLNIGVAVSLGATATQVDGLKNAYINAIKKIDVELTETQAALDSITD